MRLSDIPKPDFIDYFPHTSPGHGAAGLKYIRKEGEVIAVTKAKACTEPRCQLNMAAGRAGGEKHVKGRAHNAGVWIRDVKYSGPDPGITAEEERVQREEKALSPFAQCHYKCEVKGTLHSVCIYPRPLRVSLLDQMAQRVGLLHFTSDAQLNGRLREYLGADVASREKAA